MQRFCYCFSLFSSGIGPMRYWDVLVREPHHPRSPAKPTSDFDQQKVALSNLVHY